MYMKIIDSSLHTDLKAKTWFFIAHGYDGSVYSYNTCATIKETDPKTMLSKLKSVVKDGLINTDYWRLV